MMCCKKKSDAEPLNNANQNQCKEHRKIHKAHLILMILCCTLPILLIGTLPAFGIGGLSSGKLMSYLLILICPLSHIFMMKGMFRNKKQ